MIELEREPMSDGTTQRVRLFALSPDGRQLVLARGTQTRDVVLSEISTED